jgi:hypothetical protein
MIRRVSISEHDWLNIALFVGVPLFLLWTFVLAESFGVYMRKRAERKNEKRASRTGKPGDPLSR